MIMEFGRRDVRVPIAVPQVGQNNRVTGDFKSLRVNSLGAPFVNWKPEDANTIMTFGLPPVMYWHSRQ
jgi:hypothetical protein